MEDSFSRRLGSEDALKMAAEAGAARLEAPMSAAVTRLENSASALGDQIGDQMKTASDNLVGALDKTATKFCAIALLAITISTYGQH